MSVDFLMGARRSRGVNSAIVARSDEAVPDVTDSRIREVSGNLCSRYRKMQNDQGLAARSYTFPENFDFLSDDFPEMAGSSSVVTRQGLLRAVDRVFECATCGTAPNRLSLLFAFLKHHRP